MSAVKNALKLADLDFPLERVPRSERVSLYRMLSGKPDPLQIGIWKTELTSEEISSYHQVCGKTLGELGYSVTEPIDADKGINDGPLIRPGRAPIVKNVDRVLIQLPYRSVPGRNMLRENPLWNLFDICIVTLDNGVRGIGETMVEYTHRQVTDADIQFVMGQNAADVMWSDQVGCGLQQALFDAVAKSLDVPLYALLGNKTKDKLQIGWWAIDMPSDDLRSEMNSAIAQGYTSMKMKGRPWFDLRQQLRAIADSAPKGFRIHVDFNELITDAAAVKDYLNILRDFPIVNICEELIPQSNTNACRRLSARCDVAFARHVQSSQMIVKMASEAACDGVVLGRLGIAERLAQASAAVASRIHICNQQVGSSITAAFALHCGAVMQGPSWPAIACHNLYEEEVVRNRIEVDKGWATIPEAPGIGVDIDMQALDRYAVRSGSNPIRRPEQLIVITYPNGFSQDYTETSVYWRDYAEGRMPSSNEGVVLEALVDDGSRAWRQRYGKALLRAMSLRT